MSNFIKNFDSKKLAMYVLSQITFSSNNVEGQPEFAGNINVPFDEMNNNLAETVNLLNAAYHHVCDQSQKGLPFQISKTGVEVCLDFHPEFHPESFPRQQLMMAIDSVASKMQLPKVSKLVASLQNGVIPPAIYENDNTAVIELPTSFHNINHCLDKIKIGVLKPNFYNNTKVYIDGRPIIHNMIDLSLYIPNKVAINQAQCVEVC